MAAESPLLNRRAGVLLHPTSLPGAGAHGTLGAEAFHFVDFLVSAGISVWQMLPVCPTHSDRSPYQSPSGHAGNPALIDHQEWVQRGWLDENFVDNEGWVDETLAGFQSRATESERAAFARFCKTQSAWLDDYALFMAIRAANSDMPWWDWPEPLRDRHHDAIESTREVCQAEIERYSFEQFLFFEQWRALREYANECGVLLFGDLPIFVAHDSVDVWAAREMFLLDESGKPTAVAGVPPDYFSATGQLWGNPLYDWPRMRASAYNWWVERLRGQLQLFDLIRIDHFRGFESYWSIPADAPTAESGEWKPGPKGGLFRVLEAALGSLPLVAEDLGVITEEVRALRREMGFPGMRILHFAFDGNPENPYLPHNHTQDSVVYTGTHDNDTTMGWWSGIEDAARERVLGYLGCPSEPMPWPLIRSAFASVARLAVVPMQDLMELDGAHRMNTPGTTATANWSWRFQWSEVRDRLSVRIKALAQTYGRN